MKTDVRVGLLLSRVRVEEKWICAELEKREINYDRLDDRYIHFEPEKPQPWQQYDVILERSISYARGLYALQLFNQWGIPTVNKAVTAEICGDKIKTTSVLASAGVPQPRARVAFTTESALEAIDELGYPVVLKPVVGSWGRLLSKINDREAAEAILEHKSVLGSYQHSIFYIQEYVDKPGRDIRIFMIDEDPIAAIYRTSEHWITNTARGANGEVCPITPELRDICITAAKAVGGGVLAIDVIEHPQRGMVVNEINHTMEFHTAQPTTGINIAGLIVDYALKVAQQGKSQPAMQEAL
ncbi:MAG: lysine biosynthesis protein LysX [Anaerolineaceae bacterium]|nr:lysine biosynthesis protein LysX [Anaerolineaceae bacterium]